MSSEAVVRGVGTESERGKKEGGVLAEPCRCATWARGGSVEVGVEEGPGRGGFAWGDVGLPSPDPPWIGRERQWSEATGGWNRPVEAQVARRWWPADGEASGGRGVVEMARGRGAVGVEMVRGELGEAAGGVTEAVGGRREGSMRKRPKGARPWGRIGGFGAMAAVSR
ncbi:hypothetical protein D1007_46493 [Hordeum vulgare]|nr:hypothetical protein D1007_46493 [Hordeum vulgare]